MMHGFKLNRSLRKDEKKMNELKLLMMARPCSKFFKLIKVYISCSYPLTSLTFIAAKEEVFQESIKLKNQFRALNDDEVDFLDSQVDAKIAKERAIQQETSEQLRLFRERQDASDANGFDAAADEQAVHDSTTAELDTTNWAPSKKRKRVKEKEVIKGVKLRRNSSDVHGSHPVASAQDKPTSDSMKSMGQAVVISKKEDISTNSASPPKMQGLGLVNYDSDDEDD